MSDPRKHSAPTRTLASEKAEQSKKAKPQRFVFVSKSSPRPAPGRSEYPLAFGEYVPAQSDEKSDQLWRARLVLLNTIGRTCPIFFQTLSEKVFPAYAELANAGFDFDQEILSGRSGTSPYERILDTLLDENTEAIQKHLRGLKSKLQNWAAMFHADSAAWLFDAALHTMRGWYLAPDWRNSLRWDLPLSRVITRIPAIAFKVPGWQVQDITFTEYREFVNHHLADYEKKMREQAESHGLIRARRQYSKSNFDWFVLYQLAGWSSKKIADECSSQRLKGLDESTVLKGVKAVADLIGWNELRSKTHNRKTQ